MGLFVSRSCRNSSYIPFDSNQSALTASVNVHFSTEYGSLLYGRMSKLHARNHWASGLYQSPGVHSVSETHILLALCEGANFSHYTAQLEAEVKLRATVSRPVCLGVGHPFGAQEQTFITVGHLQPSCCGAPSLTKERVCNLLVQFAVTSSLT